MRVAASDGSQKVIGHGFNSPKAIAVDSAGNAHIADTGNYRVIKVPAGGGKQRKVGTGLSNPKGVSVDAAGNVFIADTANKRVVKIPAGGGKQHVVLKDVSRVIAAVGVAKHS